MTRHRWERLTVVDESIKRMWKTTTRNGWRSRHRASSIKQRLPSSLVRSLLPHSLEPLPQAEPCSLLQTSVALHAQACYQCPGPLWVDMVLIWCKWWGPHHMEWCLEVCDHQWATCRWCLAHIWCATIGQWCLSDRVWSGRTDETQNQEALMCSTLPYTWSLEDTAPNALFGFFEMATYCLHLKTHLVEFHIIPLYLHKTILTGYLLWFHITKTSGFFLCLVYRSYFCFDA